MSYLARSILIGAATGGRSVTGLAALALATPPGAVDQPDAWLDREWVKALLVLAAAQELVLDKLPGTPSRLKPAGLAFRAVAGIAAGIIVARRARGAEPTASVSAALGAGAAAVAGSWVGAQWRSWAAPRVGAFGAAVIEDASVIGLAALTSRRAATSAAA
jgi:uncharacterized membrane protein